MAKVSTKSKELDVLHIRLSKENGSSIMKKIKEKMKKETRNQNNCVESILVEYFSLK